jgi:transcriptional regulator with XRE-family HTH domain
MASVNGRSNRSKSKGHEGGRVTAEVRTPLHRLAEIRRREDVSRKAVASHLGTSLADVKSQERATADIPLSVLYKWQQALGVPLGELLVERRSELTPPVANRAQMVRVMRTALTIVNQSRQAGVKWLARALIDQLVEIMPELSDLQPQLESKQRQDNQALSRPARHAPQEDLFPLD